MIILDTSLFCVLYLIGDACQSLTWYCNIYGYFFFMFLVIMAFLKLQRGPWSLVLASLLKNQTSHSWITSKRSDIHCALYMQDMQNWTKFLQKWYVWVIQHCDHWFHSMSVMDHFCLITVQMTVKYIILSDKFK